MRQTDPRVSYRQHHPLPILTRHPSVGLVGPKWTWEKGGLGLVGPKWTWDGKRGGINQNLARLYIDREVSKCKKLMKKQPHRFADRRGGFAITHKQKQRARDKKRNQCRDALKVGFITRGDEQKCTGLLEMGEYRNLRVQGLKRQLQAHGVSC